MRKILIGLVAVAAMTLAMSNVYAEEYVVGGFEASGHVNTGFGFQYTGTIGGGAGGAAGLNRDAFTNFATATKDTEFGFILDEAELDLAKTFGENITARADLSFGVANLGSAANFALEQAYVTTNVALGNGLEFLVGRFDTPIGFEAVDRNDNDTITHSMLYNWYLRPRTTTGAKLYYAFNDMWDFHFYVVNDLMDTVAFNGNGTIMPSLGMRLGVMWGDEGSESTVGLSAAVGDETARVGNKIGRISWLTDVDFNIWATDAFAVGGEGIFRMDNAAAGTNDAMFGGGLVNLHYVFSDVWDGTLKYALLYQNNAAATALAGTAIYGAAGTVGCYAPVQGKALFHEIGIAGGYQITDGAKVKAEYRLDYTKYSGVAKNMAHAFVGMFAYEF